MTTIYRAGMALLLITLAAPPAFAQTAEEEAEQRLVVQMAKALRNEAAGQYEVARMYEKGVGTPRDLRLAHLWYTKAANQGYGPAVQRLVTWDGDIATMQRADKQRAEEERARQQSEAARQARERAAKEAKARQQAEAEARAARDAARARQQAEAAAKVAAERAAQQEAAKRKQTTPAAAPPAAAPVVAKPAAVPAPVPAVAAKPNAEADKAEFSANPCKGPSAKFMSTCN